MFRLSVPSSWRWHVAVAEDGKNFVENADSENVARSMAVLVVREVEGVEKHVLVVQNWRGKFALD